MHDSESLSLLKPELKLSGLNPPVIVTGRPKAVLSLRFHLFYFQHFCVSDLFGSVKMAELPPVWERAADSACHL